MACIWQVTGSVNDTVSPIEFVAFVVTGVADESNRNAREIVMDHLRGRADWYEEELETFQATPIGLAAGKEDGDGYVLDEGILSLNFLTKQHPTPVQEPPHLWDWWDQD